MRRFARHNASHRGVARTPRREMYGVHSHTRVGVRENDDASRAATRELRERIDRDTDALLVIDVQEDFIPPQGALAVRGGDEVVSVCSDVMRAFEHVVFSQDYHPKGHMSFASQHEGKSPYDAVEFPYGTQTLWPDHCVQGTKGCEFHPDLVVPSRAMVVQKGYNSEVDSYSAFYENDKVSDTGLAAYLEALGVKRVFVVGLAYDFCVKYTALDARKLGFDVFVVRDACRGVDVDGTVAAADAELADAGVRTIFTAPIETRD